MNLTLKTLGFAIIATASINLFAADAAAPAAEKPAAVAPGPNPGKQAIAVRKAAFVLIANSFKPVGDTSQGKIEYNQAEIQKRANRIAVVSEFLETAFPDTSNLGEPDTKASPDIWKKKADFDKQLKDFQAHAATLVKVAASEKTSSDAFKEAAGAIAKDCKGCHESYKVK